MGLIGHMKVERSENCPGNSDPSVLIYAKVNSGVDMWMDMCRIGF